METKALEKQYFPRILGVIPDISILLYLIFFFLNAGHDPLS